MDVSEKNKKIREGVAPTVESGKGGGVRLVCPAMCRGGRFLQAAGAMFGLG